MDEPDDFIETAAKAFIFSRLLMAAFAYLFGMCLGVGFIFYWVYREIALENNFYHRYGNNWRAEYEKYYGSLSHAHAQIAIAVCGMLAVAAVLGFASARMFRKHHHRRHRQ